MNSIKDILFKLCAADAIGSVHTARDIAADELSKYCTVETVPGSMNTVAKIDAGADKPTVMIEAHIDEVGFIVTHIDDKGFLTLAKCGGTDLRTLPARPARIHGKREVVGVFCATPPHLARGEAEFEDIAEFKLDSTLGSNAGQVISPGDFVTYCTKPVQLLGSRVTAKAIDDRAGVACLIELARRLCGKKLPVNVAFVLSDAEELGTRGARTATFGICPHQAIAIDVSFGDAPDVKTSDCGLLSRGAMIGFSPVLDKKISSRLLEIAEHNGFRYQTEVMGGSTGTDADVISLSRSGVRTGLVSIPIRNMHTDCETADIADIESVCDILEKYISEGGVTGDTTA